MFFIVCSLIGLKLYNDYQGVPYYTLINSEPINIEESRNTEGKVEGYVYEYKLQAFNDDEDEKTITFTSTGRKLTKDKYLELSYNDEKGVISWEEIAEKEIKKEVVDKLNRTR